MMQFIISFLLGSLVMSLTILAVLAFNVLFPKVLTAKLRYAVWIIILIGLIIPLRPAIGNGFVEILLPKAAQTQSGNSENLQAAPSSPEADSKQDTGDAGEDTTSGRTVSVFTICVILWGIIAFMMFSYHIWRYLRFSKMIRRFSIPVKDEKVISVLRSVQAETMHGSKKIDLKACDFISSSMLTGFLHPVILLPKKHFHKEELELIFKHELIHHKRHDLYVKLLSVIAVSMHWFNPIVYLMCQAIQADGEASCDEAVLKDTGIENRQFYAEIIIGMIGSKNTAGSILSTCFYGGKASIKRRLDSIMDTTPKIKKPAVLVLVVVAALTLFSGSVFAIAQKPSATDTSSVLPETEAIETTPSSDMPDTQASTEITAEQAKEIALEKTGGGTVTECNVDYENDRQVYEMKIVYNNMKYEMNVDVINGTVTDYSAERVNGSAGNDKYHDDDDYDD